MVFLIGYCFVAWLWLKEKENKLNRFGSFRALKVFCRGSILYFQNSSTPSYNLKDGSIWTCSFATVMFLVFKVWIKIHFDLWIYNFITMCVLYCLIYGSNISFLIFGPFACSEWAILDCIVDEGWWNNQRRQ